jgi:putative tryptophan/tyrosine transport system substrate-binding protein
LPILDSGEKSMRDRTRLQSLSFYSHNRKSKIQNRKWAVLLTIVFALTMCGARAEAQQPTKVWRIAWVTAASTRSMMPRIEVFRAGLRELGYVEGKNIIIEVRSAEGKRDRLPAIMAELLSLKVDIIVSAGAGITGPAKDATSTIPIVMSQDPDPVANGFVASLARPGGNITGLSIFRPELSGKRLELVKETLPNLSRVAVFGTSSTPGHAQTLKETELAAAAVKVQLQYVDVLDPKDFESAFTAAVKGRAGGVLWLVSGPVAFGHQKKIFDLVGKNRLPVIYELPSWVEEGGLMSYGVNLAALDRRAATYVDKILKGAKPADLPVEQPRKFELVINLKAAKQISLTIPPNVLARADRVIK